MISWILPLVSLMSEGVLLAVISGLGLLGGVGLGIKAVLERRTLTATAKATQSKAGSEDATAASIVAAAARELIDPLRAELALERKEHAEEREREREEHALELERERVKVALVRKELDAALSDVQTLRATLRRALSEVQEKTERIAELETGIARYEEFRRLNEMEEQRDGTQGV